MILNRIIRVTQRGWEYEPDQRHADLILREMHAENMKPTKPPERTNRAGRRRKETYQ